MRLDTLMEIVRLHGITLPLRPDLRSRVQMQPGDERTPASFLGKFQVLRHFYRSPEIIARITREAIADAAADSVLYMDLHFTPIALSRYQGFAVGDVFEWVTEAAQKAARQHNIFVRLIASVNRHESIHLAEQVIALAAQYAGKGVAGIDLAGNEAEFPADPFLGLFREAKAAGLALTIHAGEWGGAENVRQALADFNADRVVHGVRVMDDPAVLALARDMGTPFEVCLTSNIQTGVAPSLQEHPMMPMLLAGINVTLNTDDPSISQIALSDEYCMACEESGLTRPLLADRILAAAQAAFLSCLEREELVRRLKAGLGVLYQ